MEIIIKDHQFTHIANLNLEETPIKEVFESFFILLESIYSQERIADCLAGGFDAMEYSSRGIKARELLRTIDAE